MNDTLRHSVESIDSHGTFVSDGRGPILRRWLTFRDLLLPDSNDGFATLPVRHVGAETESGWVLFHQLQVIQVVPEEVHSYWHRTATTGPGACWRVDGSDWLASFSQRHLSRCKHYVLEFYDHIVEVVCEDLIFGAGVFDIDIVLPEEPRLRYAYLRRALSLEKQGRLVEAVSEYDHYLATSPSDAAFQSASRRRTSLQIRVNLEPVLDDAARAHEDKVASIVRLGETQTWETLRAALLTILYDEHRETWWAACVDAHIRLLSDERQAVIESNLIALVIRQGEFGEELLGELMAKLDYEGPADPRDDVRVARELARLKSSS